MKRLSYRRDAWFVLLLLVLVLPLISACGGGSTPVADEAESKIILPPGYQMAVVKTSTPTPDLAPIATPRATVVAGPAPAATPEATPATDPAKAKSDGIPRIGVAEARSKADAGEAILVDVRNRTAYEQKHVAGAISMPSNEVAKRYTELPTDKLIIFY